MKPLPLRLADMIGLPARSVKDHWRLVLAFVLVEVVVIVVLVGLVLLVHAPSPGTFMAIAAVLTFSLALPVNLQSCSAYLSLQAAKEEIERLSRIDSLTGLPNRRVFNEAIEAAENAPVTLALFDIDRFKSINDTYGHDVGDEVLSTVAGVIQRTLAGRGVVCRIGGEEFAWISVDTDSQEAERLAEAVRRAVAGLALVDHGELIHSTVSCGLASGGRGQPFRRLYNDADRALYAAKSAGRNRVAAAA